MPSEKSARASLRKRAYNQIARSPTKTYVSTARRALASGALEEAETTVLQATSALDRAVKQGAVHRNAAARRKGRLAKQLNALRGKGSAAS